MTDQPQPSADEAVDRPAPDPVASSGDAELASLVFGGPRSSAADEGDPALAELVRLGQRPVSAAVPVAGGKASPDAAASSDAAAGPDAVTAAVPATTAAPDVVAAPEEPALPVAVAVPVEPPPPVVEAGTGQPRGRSLAFRFTLAFVLGVLLVVGVGAGALYAWGQQFDGRVLPGVRVGSTDLSGLTVAQAESAITAAYGSLGTGKVTLNGPNGAVTIAYRDIGRGPDTTAILDAALAAGRGGELLAGLIGGPQAAIHGVTVASAVTYDRAKLAAAVKVLAATIDQPATDAALTAGSGGGFVVTAAKNGRAVDQNALLAALDQRLTALDAPAEITLDVPVVTVPPAVQTNVADTAKVAADRMAADLVIARGTDSWTIAGSALRALISFAPAPDGSLTAVFDQNGLDPILKTLAASINQPVQEAGLKLTGKGVVATGASREGRTLDVAAMKAAIVAQMAARQAGTAVEPLPAQVVAVQPTLTSDMAAQYAAKMVPISSYSIYYWVLVNNNWGGNIEGPANVINGTVVPAGAVFDFWKAVGDLHKVPGVGPGNAIEGGKITVTGAFGGGICTTSTTLFNAAIHAGMVPIARQNHNEYIDRYPPGLDATVWIVGNSKQTMSFKNDTQYPILIQRVITYAGSKRWITFKIWSVPNGRTTTITNTVIQPGPRAIDTIVKDPTKPVGYTFRNNTPADGAKVWVTVNIFDHGQLHWSKRYYSNYPAVNGVLIVGTKGASAPSPSPTPSPSPKP